MAAKYIEPALLELFKKRRPEHLKPGLERIGAAIRTLNNGLLDTPCLLVGGTNGKGSTAGILWRLLSILGVETALYTSPHLSSFAERIQLSSRKITDKDLAQELEGLATLLPKDLYEDLSFFEVTTLLALSIFKKFGAKFLVLEVGLGGRLDSTNVSNPLHSIISSVGYDHMSFLGSTLPEIAREKGGIIRPERPLFYGGSLHSSVDEQVVEKVLKSMCQEKGSIFYQAGRQFSLDIEKKEFSIKLPGKEPFQGKLPLAISEKPEFLQRNYTLAFAAFYSLLHEKQVLNIIQKKSSSFQTNDLNKVAFQANDNFSTAQVSWPPSLIGRFQHAVVKQKHGLREVKLIIDVCHNTEAIATLIKSLKEQRFVSSNTPHLPGIVSILRDKEVNKMLDLLKEVLDPLVLFRLDCERTFSWDNIEERHRNLKLFDNFSSAFSSLLSLEESKTDPIIVCGSLRAAGEVIDFFEAFPEDRNLHPVLSGQF